MKSANIIFDVAGVLFAPGFTNFEFEGVNFTPIEHGIEILNQCAQQMHGDGNKRHKLFLLSNLDNPSFEYLQTTFPETFNLFHGIVISGNLPFRKPDHRIFLHLLTTYELNPKTCIFIDDRAENIEAAQKLGITSILCEDHEIAEQKLKALEVL